MIAKRVVHPVVVLALLLGTTLLAAPPAAAVGVTSFEWNAPADASGPGAFRLVADFGTGNSCELLVEGTGNSQLGPSGWIRMGGSWAMISSGNTAQVHAEDLNLDTRTDPVGNWGIRFQSIGTRSGEVEFVVAVVDMNGWLADSDDPWYPARIAFECEDPVEIVSTAGSQEVVAFNHESLDGTGAGVNALLVGAQASVGDHIEATLASEEVEASIIDWAFTGPNYREYRLEMPSDTHEHSALDAGHVFDVRFTDGPGDYSFELTQVAVGQAMSLSGWWLGFNDVADLDDVL